VSETKTQVFVRLFKSLGTKEKKKNLYIGLLRDEKERQEIGKVLIKEKNIKDGRNKYFDNLFNE